MSDLNEYDVGETVFLSCLFLVGATIGRISPGQSTVFVQDATGLTLTPGAPIVLAAAGYVDGDLRTTVVSAAGQQVVLAAAAQVDAGRVTVGTPVTPSTTTCKVQKPDGSSSFVSVTFPLTGFGRAAYTISLEGDHYYRFTGTGTAAGDGWRKFVARPERVA